MDSRSLSAACQELWELDINRLVPREDYEIDLQASKPFSHHSDEASRPMFKYVNEEVFSRPTYKLFYDLLNNYEWETGVEETEDAAEHRELQQFLDAFLETKPGRYCYEQLKTHGAFSGDTEEFKRKMYYIWFKGYRRGGCVDSSGFEHVFVGESKAGKIIGFHNWIQFYLCEQQGLVNYQGVVGHRQKLDDDTDDDICVVSINFKDCDREEKDVSTMFLGTSPEFEFALLTLCFLGGQEDNYITINGIDLNIRCYTIAGGRVGAAFPDIPRKGRS